MLNKTIGIKTADGSFYPVLEAGFKGKKRLILTTIKENQQTVQIDLFQCSEEDIKVMDYVGSLVIENIDPAAQGIPEIEVIMGIDDNGNLSAIASDIASGNKQRLTTSLENFKEDQIFDVPDFDFDQETSPEIHEEDNSSPTTLFENDSTPQTISDDDNTPQTIIDDDSSPQTVTDDSMTGNEYQVSEEDRRKSHIQKKKASPLMLILFILISLLVLGGIAFGVFWLINQNSENEVTSQEEPQDISDSTEDISGTAEAPDDGGSSEDISGSDEPPVTEDSDLTEDISGSDEPPVTDTTPDDTGISENHEGVWYTIKRGDTLWDISATFLRNPQLYPIIAEHPLNNIENPDLIFFGFDLYIPEN